MSLKLIKEHKIDGDRSVKWYYGDVLGERDHFHKVYYENTLLETNHLFINIPSWNTTDSTYDIIETLFNDIVSTYKGDENE